MSTGRIISLIFRIIFYSLLILNYIYFVLLIWFPISLKNPLGFVVIFFFNFLFVMATWSTIVTSTSDPGQVPLYWGFYIGDPDSKRSRYCLMCNVFKPVRCHHCSMCNRCVLNMDHHCPWINNCIGFYNRKFFIQMVFYLNCTLIYVLCFKAKFSYDIIYLIIKNKISFSTGLVKQLGYLFLYFIDLAMEVILIQFLNFHIKLILENKTTIETLEKQRKEFNSKYDRGKWENFIEVMGVSKFLWFFPLKLYYGKPKGNGIDWIELPEENANQNIEMQENPSNKENTNRNENEDIESNRKQSQIQTHDISRNSNLTKNNGHSSMSSLY